MHQQVIKLTRELRQAKEENKLLADAINTTSNRQEEYLRNRFKLVRERHGQAGPVELFTPFVSNYGTIYRETVKGQGQLHKITQQIFEGYHKGSYRKFTGYVGSLDAQIKRAWSANNLNGLLAFTDAVFYHLEQLEAQAS